MNFVNERRLCFTVVSAAEAGGASLHVSVLRLLHRLRLLLHPQPFHWCHHR